MQILRFILLAFFFSAYLYIPGLVLATFIKKIEDYYKPLIALVFCLVFSYITLYLYLYKLPLAHLLSVLYLGLFVFSIGALIVHKGLRTQVLRPQIVLPIIFALSVCLFYNFLSFNRNIEAQPLLQSQYVIYRMPDDNILPLYFSNQILQQDTKFASGTWLFSDRPPLQTGVVLTTDIIARPKTVVTTINQQYSYQVIGSLLQCSWVLGLWALCKQLKLRNKQIAFILLLATLSGFIYLNSVFVWPKLLSASLFLGAIAIWLKPKITKPEAILSGVFIGLSLLSHTGAAFSLPILLILFARRIRFIRQIILCIAAIILLMVPWTFFVHTKNPPGDRLIKMHIAADPNDDGRSFTQALRYSYTHESRSEIEHNKLGNFSTLFHVPSKWNGYGFQQADFRFTFWSLGILNLGWLAYFANFRKRKGRMPDINLLLTGGLISLGLWCLLMFGPGYTIIHAGSYVNNLLFIGCLAALISLFRHVWIKYLAVTVAALNFFIVWVNSPNSSRSLEAPVVAASTISFLLCLAVLYLVYKSTDTERVKTG